MNDSPSQPTTPPSGVSSGPTTRRPSTDRSTPVTAGRGGNYSGGRGGRRPYNNFRGGCRGHGSNTKFTPRQEYRPKKPIESQNSNNVNDTSNESVQSNSCVGARPGSNESICDNFGFGEEKGSLGLDLKENIKIGIGDDNDDDDDGVNSQLDVEGEEKIDALQDEFDSIVPPDFKNEGLEEKSCGVDIVENGEDSRDQLDVMKAFDICPPKIGTPIMLKPSLFQTNREKRRLAVGGHNGHVLRPGMVLLKSYLTISDQVKIVKRCRDLGLGPGGFYQPGYRDGATLHLKMMCLGKNWDPDTSMYGERRPSDDAKPPDIPDEFHNLVEKAIQDSRALIEGNSKACGAEELPWMSPNICIANFYLPSGRLGLHQDKDESEENIRKRLPVVSFSIGDSGDFQFGVHRDVERAEKVLLESGDVLIFGGESRLIFHGVSSIHSGTAPKGLLDETNLRPGRLNLTFRQY